MKITLVIFHWQRSQSWSRCDLVVTNQRKNIFIMMFYFFEEVEMSIMFPYCSVYRNTLNTHFSNNIGTVYKFESMITLTNRLICTPFSVRRIISYCSHEKCIRLIQWWLDFKLNFKKKHTRFQIEMWELGTLELYSQIIQAHPCIYLLFFGIEGLGGLRRHSYYIAIYLYNCYGAIPEKRQYIDGYSAVKLFNHGSWGARTWVWINVDVCFLSNYASAFVAGN